MSHNLVCLRQIESILLTGVKPLDLSNDPQLVHRTPKGEIVYGVTCLGDETFVVRSRKAEVEVYDVSTLTEQRVFLWHG